MDRNIFIRSSFRISHFATHMWDKQYVSCYLSVNLLSTAIFLSSARVISRFFCIFSVCVFFIGWESYEILFFTKTLVYISFDIFSSFSIFYECITSSLCSCIVLGCRSFWGTRCSGTLWPDFTWYSSSRERRSEKEWSDESEYKCAHRSGWVRGNKGRIRGRK